MDEFVSFNFVLFDASGGPSQEAKLVENAPKKERLDLIARQFHDFLLQGDQSDMTPHGLMLTNDFKLRRHVGMNSGWLTFLVDRGSGKDEELEEVALVAFASADNDEGRKALLRLEEFLDLAELPSAPLVVAVRLSPKVPTLIEEWYGKAAAGFFSADV